MKTDEWQVHKKVLNITNHQKNSNENQNEVHFAPLKMVVIKNAEMTSTGKDVEEGDPSVQLK